MKYSITSISQLFFICLMALQLDVTRSSLFMGLDPAKLLAGASGGLTTDMTKMLMDSLGDQSLDPTEIITNTLGGLNLDMATILNGSLAGLSENTTKMLTESLGGLNLDITKLMTDPLGGLNLDMLNMNSSSLDKIVKSISSMMNSTLTILTNSMPAMMNTLMFQDIFAQMDIFAPGLLGIISFSVQVKETDVPMYLNPTTLVNTDLQKQIDALPTTVGQITLPGKFRINYLAPLNPQEIRCEINIPLPKDVDIQALERFYSEKVTAIGTWTKVNMTIGRMLNETKGQAFTIQMDKAYMGTLPPKEVFSIFKEKMDDFTKQLKASSGLDGNSIIQKIAAGRVDAAVFFNTSIDQTTATKMETAVLAIKTLTGTNVNVSLSSNKVLTLDNILRRFNVTANNTIPSLINSIMERLNTSRTAKPNILSAAYPDIFKPELLAVLRFSLQVPAADLEKYLDATSTQRTALQNQIQSIPTTFGQLTIPAKFQLNNIVKLSATEVQGEINAMIPKEADLDAIKAYFTTNANMFSTWMAKTWSIGKMLEETKTKSYALSLNEPFNAALLNRSSPEFMALKAKVDEFCGVMKMAVPDIYMCIIRSISQGSTVVETAVASNTTINSTTSDKLDATASNVTTLGNTATNVSTSSNSIVTQGDATTGTSTNITAVASNSATSPNTTANTSTNTATAMGTTAVQATSVNLTSPAYTDYFLAEKLAVLRYKMTVPAADLLNYLKPTHDKYISVKNFSMDIPSTINSVQLARRFQLNNIVKLSTTEVKVETNAVITSEAHLSILKTYFDSTAPYSTLVSKELSLGKIGLENRVHSFALKMELTYTADMENKASTSYATIKKKVASWCSDMKTIEPVVESCIMKQLSSGSTVVETGVLTNSSSTTTTTNNLETAATSTTAVDGTSTTATTSTNDVVTQTDATAGGTGPVIGGTHHDADTLMDEVAGGGSNAKPMNNPEATTISAEKFLNVTVPGAIVLFVIIVCMCYCVSHRRSSLCKMCDSNIKTEAP